MPITTASMQSEQMHPEPRTALTALKAAVVGPCEAAAIADQLDPGDSQQPGQLFGLYKLTRQWHAAPHQHSCSSRELGSKS